MNVLNFSKLTAASFGSSSPPSTVEGKTEINGNVSAPPPALPPQKNGHNNLKLTHINPQI